MKKICAVTMIAFVLAGCGQSGTSALPPIDAESSSGSAGQESVGQAAWESAYTAFLTNEGELPEALNIAVNGAGLADLDVDGTPELILFDPGSGASNGINIFDIDANGQVVCVSAASMFNGGFTPISIFGSDANMFHLVKTEPGQLAYYCISSNSTEGYAYEAYISFVQGDLLSLKELAFVEEEADPAFPDEKSYRYRVDGNETTDDAYVRKVDAFLGNAEELPANVSAVMLTDKGDTSDMQGALEMFKEAAAKYQPLENDSTSE